MRVQSLLTALTGCVLGLVLAASGLGAAVSDEYVLGPGDVISIAVFDHPEFSLPSIEVRPDGKISHPFLGPLVVGGTTPTSLAEAVAVKLKAEMKDPIVSVNVLQFRESKVYVIGEVNSPGPIPSTTPMSVARAIALAGGLKAKADRQKAILVPKEGAPRPLDLAQVGQEGQPAVDLRPGDTLVVQPAETSVSILGEVKQAGRYDLMPGSNTVLDAIAAGGGLTSEANRQEALIIRHGGKTERVDLAAVLSYEAAGHTIRLEGGDMLVITRSDNRATVWGAVVKPGRYALEPGTDRVMDVLAEAGGLTAEANPEEAALIRSNGEMVRVNLSGLLERHDPAANLELRAGDVLTISTRRNEVTVIGAVARPGPVAVMPGDRLTELIGLVGGVTPEADLTDVQIIRGRETKFVVNAKPIFDDNNLEANVPVKPGDTVIIPRHQREVLVFGYVKAPGRYPIADGETLMELLAQIGGFDEKAGLHKTALIRREGQEAKVFVVDMRKVIMGQTLDRNYVLQDGDVVMVPRKAGMDWQTIVTQLFQTVTLVKILQQ